MRLILPACTLLAILAPALLQPAGAQTPASPSTGTAPAPVPAVPPPTPQGGAAGMVPERVAPDAGPPHRAAPSTLPSGTGTGQDGAVPK
jgi:hypothetical protein